jgi:hypothetical protein
MRAATAPAAAQPSQPVTPQWQPQPQQSQWQPAPSAPAGYNTSPAAGGGGAGYSMPYSPDSGSSPYDVGQTSSALTAADAAAAAPSGMSLPVKLAIGAGAALVLYLGYRTFGRRGGGRRKS